MRWQNTTAEHTHTHNIYISYNYNIKFNNKDNASRAADFGN